MAIGNYISCSKSKKEHMHLISSVTHYSHCGGMAKVLRGEIVLIELMAKSPGLNKPADCWTIGAELETNMRSMNLVAVSVLSIGLFGACGRSSGESDKERYLRELPNLMSSAAHGRVLLQELRSGRTSNAVELLEQQVDVAVIGLFASTHYLPPAERDEALRTLREIRVYREQFPRKREAVLEDTENVAADLDSMRARAQQLLSEIPEN